MKCKKCGQELKDCNDYIRDSPSAKKLGIKYDPTYQGYAYLCMNPDCKKYGKLLVKGIDFDKKTNIPFLKFLKVATGGSQYGLQIRMCHRRKLYI